MSNNSKGRDYQEKWYSKNKDKVSISKKDKYANNKEYRDRVKQRAARQRESLKQTKYKAVKVVINGSHCMMHTIHSVSVLVGKTYQTLKSWEKNGVIPECVVVGRTRYYTPIQSMLIKAYVDSACEESRIKNSDLMFKLWSQ
ncbi:MAG: MerR family transcriptional regulator [Chlamydiia bacterium]|nr:MerR family transcriptional regulator [Chlamydiia bacterium]